MAMGKGIVASDLDQVGEILEHGRAAQMVMPGDVDSLVDGLRDLIDDPARRAAPWRRSAAHGGRAALVARAHQANRRRVARRVAVGVKRLLAISWEMPPLSGPRAVQVTRTLVALGVRSAGGRA